MPTLSIMKNFDILTAQPRRWGCQHSLNSWPHKSQTLNYNSSSPHQSTQFGRPRTQRQLQTFWCRWFSMTNGHLLMPSKVEFTFSEDDTLPTIPIILSIVLVFSIDGEK